MNVAAALLLIGACGSASRTITVEPSIEQIVVQVVAGGVSDVLARRTHAADWSGARVYAAVEAEDIRLRIDGQPRTGVLAWAAAAYRVSGYALRRDADGGRSDSGAVDYSYRLRVRGYNIRRTTRVQAGRVSLVTDVYGSIGPRGELYHVRLVVHAVEGVDGTRITGVATGDSEIGKNCRLVSRIASRVISNELDSQLLGRIQSGGIDLYRAGGITEVLR